MAGKALVIHNRCMSLTYNIHPTTHDKNDRSYSLCFVFFY
jgi:hypothetical protein